MTVTKLFDLSGKTALIVGSGLVPRAIAGLFGEAGAEVVRVAEPDLSEEGVAAHFASLSHIDILVNGVVRTGAWPIEKLTMEEWDRVCSVNLRGAFLLMRAAVSMMQRQGQGGRLINISTIGSVHPVLNGNFAYGASRAGMNALTRQFALDFAADGILSNAILVGPIQSDPFPETMPMPPTGPAMAPGRMLGGQGKAEQIAPTALLLASRAGDFVNGQMIAIDGGFTVS